MINKNNILRTFHAFSIVPESVLQHTFRGWAAVRVPDSL